MKQGEALIRTIETLETIKPTRLIERVQVWLLLQAYRRRLRAIIEAAPSWIGEQILSASEGIGEKIAAVWMSEI
jgi:hypothetical protein